jgi:hypothetical protein
VCGILETSSQNLTTPIGIPDSYIITLVAKMGPNSFMEMMWMVHALKQNKDMVAYLETIKEMTLKRARMP